MAAAGAGKPAPRRILGESISGFHADWFGGWSSLGRANPRQEPRSRKAPNERVVYAVGHSTRPVAAFIDILRAHDVDTLVDIRTIPKSRHNPQFNGNDLALSLCSAGIGYIHLKELGGLRRAVKGSKNTGWRNASFRGFADYMQTEEFGAGLERLVRLAERRRVAIMCAEGNPFRCHRSLVADALTVRGGKVIHIASRGEGRPHRLTPFARVSGTSLSYPAEAAEPRARTTGRAYPVRAS